MEVFTEQVIIYGIAFLFTLTILYLYLRKLKKRTAITTEKILRAKADGLYEPVSLHPVIADNCIQSGACITACPEHDVIGIKLYDPVDMKMPAAGLLQQLPLLIAPYAGATVGKCES